MEKMALRAGTMRAAQRVMLARAAAAASVAPAAPAGVAPAATAAAAAATGAGAQVHAAAQRSMSSWLTIGAANLRPAAASSSKVLRRVRAFSALPAHQQITMPGLSPTMTQGNIATWHKKEGDEVAAGDVLCEIETDKATLEMESMEDGVIAKILKPNGAQNIAVGVPIAIMVEDAKDIPAFENYEPTVAPAAAPAGN